MPESAMDSITQLVLGSAVGVAVMGRRTSVWKAALWGGVCGTLPDLDALIDHGDPIRNMTLHRAQSHSLFYLSLLSPLLAWGITRIHRGAASFRRWWLLAWLALITHPLLDWMTIYGTQLALPFTDYPFAVGSIFVIDPLYTLPLAVGVVAALITSRNPAGRSLRWNLAGLLFSTAYLAWSLGAQQHVSSIARASVRAQAIEAQRLLVVPAPFNTLLWRILAMEADNYAEGYYSLLDPDQDIVLRRYPRGTSLIRQTSDNWYVNRIAWFSHGFFSMRRADGTLLISDLRMGQEPDYTFTFTLPEPAQTCGQSKPALVSPRIDLPTALGWLWQRIGGVRTPYPGEADPSPLARVPAAC